MNKREEQINTKMKVWRPKSKEGYKKEEVRHDAGIVIIANDEEMTWAKKDFIGFVRNANQIHILHDLIVEEGVTSIKVIPLKEDKVFLKVDDEEYLKELVKESEVSSNNGSKY